MKTAAIFFLLAAALGSVSLSQETTLLRSAENFDWEWQNPLPTGNRLWDVDFVDANHGWVVGEHSTILSTTDGGHSWKSLNSGVEVQGRGSLNEVHFRQVKFFDLLNGIIGGVHRLGH